MNIHQLLSDPNSPHNSLGPVTVKKNWGISGQGNSARLDLDVHDDSGETKLKIWGAASGTNIQEGDTIIVRSNGGPKDSLKASEYNGKWSISANGCKVEFPNNQGGSTTAVNQPARSSGGYQRPRPGGGGGGGGGGRQDPNERFLTKAELAQEVCELAAAILEAGAQCNLPDEVTFALANNAHHVGPLYWFGKRWIGDGKG